MDHVDEMPPAPYKPWVEYAAALGTFAGVSLLNLWLQSWIGYQAIALVYLLAVVLLALFVGRGPILFGTVLTALGWSFIFAPPRYSFHIGSFYDKMMFAMYFIVALTVAQLTARLRAEQLAEQRREEHARALYVFTRELADAGDQADILDRTIGQIGKVFQADVAVVFAASNGKQATQFSQSTWRLDNSEQALAQQALTGNQVVGRGTQASPETAGIYLPLSAGSAPEGVLAVRTNSGQELSSEQRDLLENFARQTALVLERQRLRDAEVRTKLLSESERLGRTLLNSVSHELRTPLAAIATAAGTLRDSDQLTPLQQRLSIEIESATARLNRVVHSLLNAARIQSGQVRPKLDWCDPADVVRAALREVAPLLAQHRVEKKLQPGLPLIRGDFTLLQQAVTNLLVNAATYAKADTTIEVSAVANGNELALEVSDRGPGLPPDELNRMFELFHRAPSSKPGGTGLGLAIVKGFVDAQGGRVQAANRPGGGATFSIFLPIGKPPEVSEETA
ncbi:MAG TPA: ATP-binding protein [Verrucomicrobiae bacterium]|nr:ATP-binding protein [Verrucomicrobiae bacterium]